MTRKDILTKKKQRLEKRRNDLKARSAASTDVNEVRAINEQLEEIMEDLADVNDELSAIEEEERSHDDPNAAAQQNGAQQHNAGIVGSFITPAAAGTRSEEEDPRATLEYRKAFKRYVQTGVREVRAGEVISTNDVGVLIPTTVMNEVVKIARASAGEIYAKVRKLSVPGGIDFPVEQLVAKFRWINESTVSPNQKESLGKISFGYYTAEIRIAQSFLSSIVTLDAFESHISESIAEAYLEAMDEGVVSGNGDGKMTGILHDPRVANNVVEMTEDDISDWEQWRKLFFSKLKKKYRRGEFMFSTATVEGNLYCMKNANGDPLYKAATGDEPGDGKFFGRVVEEVEPDILPDFDTAADGDVIGIYWQPNQYAINENFAVTIRRYYDEDTNEWINKALVVVDGKVLDPTGFYLIKKKVTV